MDECFGEFECECDALVSGSYVFVGFVLLIELVEPLWELVHVVGAGDEVSCFFVVPVGCVGAVACG